MYQRCFWAVRARRVAMVTRVIRVVKVVGLLGLLGQVRCVSWGSLLLQKRGIKVSRVTY